MYTLSKNAFSEKNAVHPMIGTTLNDFLTSAFGHPNIFTCSQKNQEKSQSTEKCIKARFRKVDPIRAKKNYYYLHMSDLITTLHAHYPFWPMFWHLCRWHMLTKTTIQPEIPTVINQCYIYKFRPRY